MELKPKVNINILEEPYIVGTIYGIIIGMFLIYLLIGLLIGSEIDLIISSCFILYLTFKWIKGYKQLEMNK